MEKETTTTITISRKNRDRIARILKHGESLDFGIALLLVTFARPSFNRGGIHNRTINPPLTEEEIETIRKQLTKET